MSEKKKFVLNCDVCDTRNMKEEDYRHFEQMTVNADYVLVSDNSKSILNHLPITMNSDKMIPLENDVKPEIRTINGNYEITGDTGVLEHTMLFVNGLLTIASGTEASLEKYEGIVVNGAVRYPKSLEGYLAKMTVNGSAQSYPDDCILLDATYTMDRYFPLRVKVESKYYVDELVIIEDEKIDIAKLVEKGVQFFTKKLIVPECMVEDCAAVFDEQVEFIVVPEGMTLVYGDTILDEELMRKKGGRLFVYGNFSISKETDMELLCKTMQKLIVRGNVTLQAGQEAAFQRIDAEYDDIEVEKNSRKMINALKEKLDKGLFDCSPDGIEVRNVALVVIAEDVTPEMIREKLQLENCAKIICNEKQESAVCMVADNVGQITTDSDDGAWGMLKSMVDTKMVNADYYVM